MAKANQTKNVTEEVKNEVVKEVKNEVVKGEKVVAIPVDPLNEKDKVVKVTINGKEHKIKRGVQQTVSKEVYEILVIAGYVVEG